MARVSGVGSDAGGHVAILSSDVRRGMASGRPCCCSRRSSHGAGSLLLSTLVRGIHQELIYVLEEQPMFLRCSDGSLKQIRWQQASSAARLSSEGTCGMAIHILFPII